jgi:hypothetical protein
LDRRENSNRFSTVTNPSVVEVYIKGAGDTPFAVYTWPVPGPLLLIQRGGPLGKRYAMRPMCSANQRCYHALTLLVVGSCPLYPSYHGPTLWPTAARYLQRSRRRLCTIGLGRTQQTLAATLTFTSPAVLCLPACNQASGIHYSGKRAISEDRKEGPGQFRSRTLFCFLSYLPMTLC